MNNDMIYEVTKVEKTKDGYLVTAKDTDQSKSKHRNHTALVADPSLFPLGTLVKFVPEVA